MAGKLWRDLHPAGKALIVVMTVLDAGLRVLALRDLSARDAQQVNGPRWLWRAALGLVASSGVLPLAYFVKGRKSAVVTPIK
ncbi:hypothetical protein SAMN04488581_4799 [Mycolicibacterium neoaurum]|uniref:hypothetical protein n=1 Tax=Mycolicibacterium neoaurum TaxID=1795 RepID=UPI00056AFE0E|nr:hypothetical protein [Mycolicibacterium neoaurum]SDE81528.1 hypothetical protein SAMN04488581_4799 [Mycolicibacterium neoaurum]